MNSDHSESDKIQERLDEGETVIRSATQSRILPGGAALVCPNTVFLTQKRVIIRNPTRLGFGENIEEYYYLQITNVRLEKGLLSSSLVFFVRGMTELSKNARDRVFWGRKTNGTIDAIPKGKAEDLYRFIRQRIRKPKSRQQPPPPF